MSKEDKKLKKELRSIIEDVDKRIKELWESFVWLSAIQFLYYLTLFNSNTKNRCKKYDNSKTFIPDYIKDIKNISKEEIKERMKKAHINNAIAFDHFGIQH